MDDISILTFWGVPNYGTFLQAYALQKYLQAEYPQKRVVQIAYLNKKHYNKYFRWIDTDYKCFLINPKFYLGVVRSFGKKKKLREIRQFAEYYDIIPHTETMTSRVLAHHEFGNVVIGSDIVWDFSVKFFGNDRFLFGNGLRAKNKIAYAASFGMVQRHTEIPQYVTDGLRGLNKVSVRDQNSANIVQDVCGYHADIVIDPTFLWDFCRDPRIKDPAMKNYVVVYGSFFSEEQAKAVKDYAAQRNLIIVCLNSLDDHHEWCDIQINQDKLDPFEWLGYFKCAEVVMTCTYHGLMFGLIFKKKVFFNMTDFIYAKASSFIEALGISDLLLQDDPYVALNTQWDYAEIDKKIEGFVRGSKNFLADAIQ